jgi:hypothetical protein
LVKLAERVKRKRYKSSGEEIKLFVDDSQDHVEAEDEGLAKNWTKKKVKGACTFSRLIASLPSKHVTSI